MGRLLVAAVPPPDGAPASLTRGELAYIESDPPDPPVKVPWRELLPFRQTWAFAIGKFLTDSIWWFYLFWFPLFMTDRFGVDLKTIGLPMITVYLLADVGSVGGGWLSSALLKRGWTANAARKTAMLVCALCIVPVGVGAARRQRSGSRSGSSASPPPRTRASRANLFTLTSDMFPRKAVGSVVGIGGFAGAMGGFFMNLGAGRLEAESRAATRRCSSSRASLTWSRC